MPGKLTPEQRLQKYKQYLSELAKKDGSGNLSAKISIPKSTTPSEDVESRDLKEAIRATIAAAGSRSQIKKPISERGGEPTERQNPVSLVSPSKRELNEFRATRPVVKLSVISGKEKRSEDRQRIRLQVKEESLQSSFERIKRKREQLDRRYKRKQLTNAEYDSELEALVKEGSALLREKAEITKAIDEFNSS
ncbi:MAG: hypothetical protein ACXABL_13135 [Candidatus Thorarchaeota archaeon]